MRSVLIVEDDRNLAGVISQTLRNHGFRTAAASSAEDALRFLQGTAFDVILGDLRLEGEMSGIDLLRALRETGDTTPFIVITAFGEIPDAVVAMKLGAHDFLRKGDFTLDELVAKIKRVFEVSPSSVIAESIKMKEILRLARRIAKSDATVLILGESGVGKEVVARYIHSASLRANKSFVAVNLAAVPDNLLESELFGYEKGAFTGADKRKPGKFELANGGTILLDEIAEMSPNLQAKLLRVLQDKTVERLGGIQTIKVDTRIIATTNRDAKKLVEEGRFREDLFFRLSVFPLKIPPLRERREDIIPLAQSFLKPFCKKYAKGIKRFSESAMRKLLGYEYPGNVRELQNIVERAVILCDTDEIADEHILFDMLSGEESVEVCKKEGAEPPTLNIKAMERVFIIKALERTGWNKTHAARLLGVTVRTLRNKLKEYEIEKVENG